MRVIAGSRRIGSSKICAVLVLVITILAGSTACGEDPQAAIPTAERKTTVQSTGHALSELKDPEKLLALLPEQLRGRIVELDDQEMEPDRYLVANLVEDQDRSTVATVSITVTPGPVEADEMTDDSAIYEPFNSPFKFERVPDDKRPEFGTHSYTRINTDDPKRPGWALYSDRVNVSLVYPGVRISDSDLWTMASDVRQFLLGS